MAWLVPIWRQGICNHHADVAQSSISGALQGNEEKTENMRRIVNRNSVSGLERMVNLGQNKVEW